MMSQQCVTALGTWLLEAKAQGLRNPKRINPMHTSSHLLSCVHQLRLLCPYGKSPTEIQQWQLRGIWTEARPPRGQSPRDLARAILRFTATRTQMPVRHVPSLCISPAPFPRRLQYTAKVRVELGQRCQNHRNESSRPRRSAPERANPADLPGKLLLRSSSRRSPARPARAPRAATQVIFHITISGTLRQSIYN